MEDHCMSHPLTPDSPHMSNHPLSHSKERDKKERDLKTKMDIKNNAEEVSRKKQVVGEQLL